jgi:hypothetical protein
MTYLLLQRVKSMFLSNKMMSSVLGPVLQMHWKDVLLPLKNPPNHIKIKVIANIFEAWIGAIVQQDNGLLTLEEWWCDNMTWVIQYTAFLSFNAIPAHQYIFHYLHHHMGKYLTLCRRLGN